MSPLFNRKSPGKKNERLIRKAYRHVLGRDADPDGLSYYQRQLSSGALRPEDLADSLKTSLEYREKSGVKTDPATAVHHSRMMLFAKELPKARRVLDLGGAAIEHPEGALLAMGYPHTPEVVAIVDLPPEQRLEQGKGAEPSLIHNTRDGVSIHYHYRSMADLECFEDESFDLVVSGESIEHISEADADHMVREAYRVLEPGGHFCLDTPNAALTRLHSPDELIHPEHQKEYLVGEIRQKLSDAGFLIHRVLGICPMPESVRSGKFDEDELVNSIGLSERAEESYLFFVHAIKPQRA